MTVSAKINMKFSMLVLLLSSMLFLSVSAQMSFRGTGPEMLSKSKSTSHSKWFVKKVKAVIRGAKRYIRKARKWVHMIAGGGMLQQLKKMAKETRKVFAIGKTLPNSRKLFSIKQALRRAIEAKRAANQASSAIRPVFGASASFAAKVDLPEAILPQNICKVGEAPVI